MIGIVHVPTKNQAIAIRIIAIKKFTRKSLIFFHMLSSLIFSNSSHFFEFIYCNNPLISKYQRPASHVILSLFFVNEIIRPAPEASATYMLFWTAFLFHISSWLLAVPGSPIKRIWIFPLMCISLTNFSTPQTAWSIMAFLISSCPNIDGAYIFASASRGSFFFENFSIFFISSEDNSILLSSNLKILFTSI